jgi:hypothetical protein
MSVREKGDRIMAVKKKQMSDKNKDTRSDWIKKVDEYSEFLALLLPDDRIEIKWGHKDASVMNKAVFSGPCAVAFIID